MSEPFIGEIRMFGFNFPPRGWALCDGQILPISQNQALFSLLGTTYGGNGTTTFALPDLRGRTPVNSGQSYTLGQSAGEENHTLIVNEIPAHNHLLMGSGDAAAGPTPVSALLAVAGSNTYTGFTNPTLMGSSALATAGGNQPHPNVQPLLVVNFSIALQGVFPSRN